MADPTKAKGVLSYFTRHGTAANLLLLIMVILGLAAAPQMRAQFFPDVIIEQINVSVDWDDAGPEDIDHGIVGVILPTLQAINGVEESSAESRTGQAKIELEFEPGWDMARAFSDTESALAGITDLPEDADPPEVSRREYRDRVTDVVISGPVDVTQLARFMDDFVLRLFEAGVTRTTTRGIASPQTEVIVPTEALIRHDLSLSQIAQAIGAEARTDPAGDIDAANARLRSGASRRSAEEIGRISLRSNPDGSRLTVADVAEVRVGGVDRNTAFFVDGNAALALRVDRSSRGDAIEMQRLVEEIAAETMTSLPPGVEIELTRTRAAAISGRLGILLDNGLMGLALVVGLLFLFLNARIAFWVAAGIPVAMSAAIAIMYVSGISLNMVSIFGLIITLGIVVDDAIVVGEHADFRARRLGESPVEAAENAARRMALPVLTATITTVIAFWGLTTIGGRFGELIRDIPFTVIAVLIASLVECFLILPNHMRHALAHTAKEHWYDWPSRKVNIGFRWFRETVFRPLIHMVIVARYPVIAGAVLILSSQAVLFLNEDVRWRFFNAPERGSVTGNFATTQGAVRQDALDQMNELGRAVETVATQYAERYGENPLDFVMLQVGGLSGPGLPGAETKQTDQLGAIAIDLIDADLRPEYSAFDFLRDVQAEVVQLPMTEIISFRGWRSGPGGDALDVQFFGAETGQLKAAAEALKRELALYPEVSALEDTMVWDKEEVSIDLTPQARVLGFTIDEVGQVLRHRLNGVEAARYPVGTRTATIRVEVPDSEKTADFLQRVLLRAASGQYVPLADLVTVERVPGFSTIRRENGVRVISVTGDLSEDDPARAAEVVEALTERILPQIESEYSVGYTISGLAAQEREFLSGAVTGFTLCLLGIFLTLAWIFSSWTRPLVIMAIIPFGMVGTIWGHYIWDVPLSIFTVVGVIGMTGIIINDSIVLITTVDEYAETRGLRPAIVDAVCDRFRPVLLTTLTTVLGLAPLLYEQSIQAQFLKPTIITLVYGLGFGFFLVLLVVPALLASGQDFQRNLASGRRALGVRHALGELRFSARLLAAALLGWFVITLGMQVVTGDMLIDNWLPEALRQAPTGVAFLIFAAGAILTTLLAYIVSALMLWRRGSA